MLMNMAGKKKITNKKSNSWLVKRLEFHRQTVVTSCHIDARA